MNRRSLRPLRSRGGLLAERALGGAGILAEGAEFDGAERAGCQAGGAPPTCQVQYMGYS